MKCHAEPAFWGERHDMIIRKIYPGEVKRTEELFSVAFETAYEEKRDPEIRYQEKYAAFEDDDQTMMCCLTATGFSVNFDGNEVKMAGIGGVASLPQYRRKGGIRACFTKMLPELYAEDILFSYLYPFSTEYYRKFGYEMGCRGWKYQLKLAFIPQYAGSGTAVLIDQYNRDQLLPDIRQIYLYWQKKYNGMICNAECEYRFIMEADPYRTQEFTWIYRSKDGKPKAYMTYRKVKEKEEQVLLCSKMVYADTEGLKGLLSLAKTMAADHSSIIFTLPQDCEMEPFLTEISFGAYRKEQVNLGMIRVVNVQKVLELAAYRGTGSICLKISDAWISQNNAVFEVQYENGRAVRVQVISNGEALPQMELSIQAFSQLAAGCLRGSLTDNSGVSFLADQTSAAQVFYRKPAYIMEFF